MTQSQAKALLRQLAHINTREAKDSQRMDAMEDAIELLAQELQKLRALIVCDYHSREMHVMVE